MNTDTFKLNRTEIAVKVRPGRTANAGRNIESVKTTVIAVQQFAVRIKGQSVMIGMR
jgi:hypothetical protein